MTLIIIVVNTLCAMLLNKVKDGVSNVEGGRHLRRRWLHIRSQYIRNQSKLSGTLAGGRVRDAPDNLRVYE